MKALSLWDPYATLVALGKKQTETRGKPYSHRGDLAIHVAKATGDLKEALTREPFKSVLAADGFEKLSDFPLGCVVAVVELYDCVVMTNGMILDMTERAKTDESVRLDLAFGAWEPGRFAYRLRNVRRLAKPIPAKGWQGPWNWTAPANLHELFLPSDKDGAGLQTGVCTASPSCDSSRAGVGPSGPAPSLFPELRP